MDDFKLLPQQNWYMREMAKPDSYGMNLDRQDAAFFLSKGLIEWLPPNQWSSTIYGLTAKGREYVKGLPNDRT